MRDVVIVGGGLAGLAAAHALSDRRVRILERDDRLGGRVRSHGEAPLGACFALPATTFPPGFTPGARRLERGPIQLHLDGQVYTADSAWGCLAKTPYAELFAECRSGRRALTALPEAALAVLNAFFRQVHPGDIRDYVPARQKDVVRELFPDAHVGGNGAVIDAYARAIEPWTEVETGRCVISIEEHADGVRVWHRDAALSTLRCAECAAVIVATTADVARRLVRPMRRSCAELLESVRYGSYTVVVLVSGVPAPDGALRCVLDPQGAPDVFLQQGTAQIAYYSDALASAAAARSDAELIAQTAASLERLGLARPPLVSAKVQRWVAAGTVISPRYARAKEGDHRQATPRIFLSGDYTAADPAWGYGTNDAVASGRATAAKLREMMDAG